MKCPRAAGCHYQQSQAQLPTAKLLRLNSAKRVNFNPPLVDRGRGGLQLRALRKRQQVVVPLAIRVRPKVGTIRTIHDPDVASVPANLSVE